MIRIVRSNRPRWADVADVIAVSLAVRALFLYWKPREAISWDLSAWSAVLALLDAGQNPYETGGPHAGAPMLSWPPFWLPLLYGIRAVGAALGLSVTASVQSALLVAEWGVIAVLVGLLWRFGLQDPRPLLIAGIALNPFCILLIVQHGNFDILVGLAVLLFLSSLLRFRETSDPGQWLLSCLFLGLGIGLKTVPVVLLPLLLIGVRLLSARIRALGALLAMGFPLYGLIVLDVLSSQPIARQVLGYRSAPGWFGLTGLLRMLGREPWISGHSTLFVLLLGIAIAALALAIWRGWLTSQSQIVLAALWLLALIPAVGPGYGPQYLYWFWPLVVLAFAVGSPRLRIVLAGFTAVAVITYVLEYALIATHGAFWVHRHPSETARRLSALLQSVEAQTLLRLPLFLAYLLLLVGVLIEILRLERNRSTPAT